MMGWDHDLLVIGGGSGGVRAARRAAELGRRVALAEAAHLGGTCVNLGCIPKKLLSYAAEYAQIHKTAAGYGLVAPAPQLDWDHLRAAVAATVARLRGHYRRGLTEAGVTILPGVARLVGPHTVAVGEGIHTAERVLLAVGGQPRRPDVPGAQYGLVSDAMFSLPALPAHLVVVGGGYIAVEMASIFHGLGAAVTLVHRGPRLLRGFDGEAAGYLEGALRAAGIEILLETEVAVIRAGPGDVGADMGRTGHEVRLRDGRRVATQAVLFATGRVARTAGLGLEDVGIVLDPTTGEPPVDTDYRTALPWLYALGDCIAGPKLTPVAIAQAEDLIGRLYGHGPRSIDYRWVPTAVFSHPPLAACGYTEAAARAAFPRLEIYGNTFTPLRQQLSPDKTKALVKLLVDGESRRLLGAHMVGEGAPEILQALAVALAAGLTKEDLDRTMALHPTQAEEFLFLRTPTVNPRGTD
jgi:glutathione reductase (NADPH)